MLEDGHIGHGVQGDSHLHHDSIKPVIADTHTDLKVVPTLQMMAGAFPLFRHYVPVELPPE